MCWAGIINLKKSRASWQKIVNKEDNLLAKNYGFKYEQKLWILKKQGHLG